MEAIQGSGLSPISFGDSFQAASQTETRLSKRVGSNALIVKKLKDKDIPKDWPSLKVLVEKHHADAQTTADALRSTGFQEYGLATSGFGAQGEQKEQSSTALKEVASARTRHLENARALIANDSKLRRAVNAASRSTSFTGSPSDVAELTRPLPDWNHALDTPIA